MYKSKKKGNKAVKKSKKIIRMKLCGGGSKIPISNSRIIYDPVKLRNSYSRNDLKFPIWVLAEYKKPSWKNLCNSIRFPIPRVTETNKEKWKIKHI